MDGALDCLNRLNRIDNEKRNCDISNTLNAVSGYVFFSLNLTRLSLSYLRSVGSGFSTPLMICV